MYNKTNYNWKHVVGFSPWPFCTGIRVFRLLVSRVYSWYTSNFYFFFYSLIMVIIVSSIWWSDIIHENFMGFHNRYVSTGFRYGMIFFILSEVLFFFRFFWAYFHKVFRPSLELGREWPPYDFVGIVIDPFAIPLLNTVLLLSSGLTVTWAHHRLIAREYKSYLYRMVFTILLGLVFLYLQFFEYRHSYIRFKSTIYGSCFFILTGFHGLHVTIGTIMLIVCFIRGLNYHFSNNSHVGFLISAWYWHFVDVVWLFLYFFVYWYGY